MSKLKHSDESMQAYYAHVSKKMREKVEFDKKAVVSRKISIHYREEDYRKYEDQNARYVTEDFFKPHWQS